MIRLLILIVFAVSAYGAYNYFTGNDHSNLAPQLEAEAARKAPTAKLLRRYGKPDERVIQGTTELWVFKGTFRNTELLVLNSRAERVCVTSRLTQQMGFGVSSCQDAVGR